MAKKPAKKAATKATPKPKLKEGQYSHKFLTRLRPEVGEILEGLMKSTNNKTYNGAVVHLIEKHSVLLQDLETTRAELKTSKQQMNVQANLLFGLKNNFKQLQDLKLIDVSFNDDEMEYCEDCGTKLVSEGWCPHCK